MKHIRTSIIPSLQQQSCQCHAVAEITIDLKNGDPQGSVLAPLLFDIYTSDLPVTVGRKFAYADDLTILHYASNWQALAGALTQEMTTLFFYLYKWKLKLSTT